MSRPSQTESAYVQTIVRSKILVRFSRFKVEYVQTIPDQKRICPGFLAFLSRPSCASKISTLQHQNSRLLSVHVQTFVRSLQFRAFMSRLSFVHVQTFVRSLQFRAFICARNFIISKFCNFVILNARRPPLCDNFELDSS